MAREYSRGSFLAYPDRVSPRLRVALLFGGRSGEHEVSVRSGASVARGLAPGHDVLPILVDHEGGWWFQEGATPAATGGRRVYLVAAPGDGGALRALEGGAVVARPDVYFPVLHGTYGEDGTVQGLLELASVPYVGSGVAASAAAMDKELMKGLFAAAGVPQTPHRVLRRADRVREGELVAGLGLPLFVKPANLGSSVGVSKVKAAPELRAALDAAFAYDRKVVVEKGVDAREVEISVLGNDDARASLPGEILPDREFYDYDSKYSAESRTELRIPAPLELAQVEEIQRLAVLAFHAVDACGYARVDFLLDRKSGRVLVNEINTIPGFTSISMFPKMWEATGLPYPQLLARLVELGRERHAERAGLLTKYSR
jgi:D-alanine-D-alanine ligase